MKTRWVLTDVLAPKIAKEKEHAIGMDGVKAMIDVISFILVTLMSLSYPRKLVSMILNAEVVEHVNMELAMVKAVVHQRNSVRSEKNLTRRENIDANMILSVVV